MSFYHLKPTVHDNLLVLLSNAQIKGADASNLVRLAALLKQPVKAEGQEPNYFPIDEDLVKFAIDVVNGSTIRGNMAVAILDILDALHSPRKEVPYTAIPPKPPPPPPSLERGAPVPPEDIEVVAATMPGGKKSKSSSKR